MRINSDKSVMPMTVSLLCSTIQIEQLKRKKWKTRSELANEKFDFMDSSRFGYISSVEFKANLQRQPA